jgi:hypothetical protein
MPDVSPLIPPFRGRSASLARQSGIDRRHRDRMAAKTESQRIRQIEAEARLATVQHRHLIATAGQQLAAHMQSLAGGQPVDASWLRARLGELGVLAVQAGDLATARQVLEQIGRLVAAPGSEIASMSDAELQQRLDQIMASLGLEVRHI